MKRKKKDRIKVEILSTELLGIFSREINQLANDFESLPEVTNIEFEGLGHIFAQKETQENKSKRLCNTLRLITSSIE